MTIHIGISGWRYAGWRGVFYPKALAQTRELAYASRAVDMIEINGSHYSLQTIGSYRSWYEATPAYAEPALDRWAQRIRAWAKGREPRDAKRVSQARPERETRDVFCYFDNDRKVEAPFDARRLKERLNLDVKPLAEITSEIAPAGRRRSSRGRAAAPEKP